MKSKSAIRWVIFIMLDVVLLAYLALTLFASMRVVLVDFMCGAIVTNGTLYNFNQLKSIHDGAVFVSETPVHAHGGGCFAYSPKEGETFHIGDSAFRATVHSSAFAINGVTLASGVPYSKAYTRISLSDPWWLHRYVMTLHNSGLVTSLGSYSGGAPTALNHSIPVLTGESEVQAKFNYGTALFVVLLVSLPFIVFNRQKGGRKRTG